ncbi:GNAT family N-acetyltransferase [Streptomyces tubercidicus]
MTTAALLGSADPANPTSNALYRRIGYVPVTDFAVYDFSGAEW